LAGIDVGPTGGVARSPDHVPSIERSRAIMKSPCLQFFSSYYIRYISSLRNRAAGHPGLSGHVCSRPLDEAPRLILAVRFNYCLAQRFYTNSCYFH
jgi:hypothetical protein